MVVAKDKAIEFGLTVATLAIVSGCIYCFSQ